jgi:hypothetical protein
MQIAVSTREEQITWLTLNETSYKMRHTRVLHAGDLHATLPCTHILERSLYCVMTIILKWIVCPSSELPSLSYILMVY